MAALTTYLKGEIIKHIFRTGSFTKPTNLTIHLYTAAPSDSGGGTEVTATGYSSQSLAPLDANWNAPSGNNGLTDNASAIDFGTWTTGPTTVTHMAIKDQSGNYLLWGALSSSKTIAAGDAARFSAGALDITWGTP